MTLSISTRDDAFWGWVYEGDDDPLGGAIPDAGIERTRPQEVEERSAVLRELAPLVRSPRTGGMVVPRFVGCGSPLALKQAGARAGEVEAVYRISADGDHIRVVQGEGGRIGFRGVVQCGHGYLCLKCGPRVAARQGRQLGRVVGQWHTAHGWGSALLLTVTMPHRAYHRLSALMKGLQGAWSDVYSSGRRKKRWVSDYGFEGFYRAFDLTHGEANGWHPHIHALVFFDRALSRDQLEAWRVEFFRAFKARLEAKGLEAPVLERVQLERPRSEGDLARYLAKCAGMGHSEVERLSFEVAGSAVKRRSHNKAGRRTLREILEDTADEQRTADVDLYREIVEALSYKRLWARSTRGALADLWREIEAEIEAEEEAEETEEEELLRLPLWMYGAARSRRWLWCVLLLAGDDAGRESLERGVDGIWQSLVVVSPGYQLDGQWISEARRAPPLGQRVDAVRDWLIRGFQAMGRAVPAVLCSAVIG